MTHSSLRLAPSLLSADFACLGQEVQRLEQAGADWIHLDVMDQHYVPNLTVGPLVCQAIRPHTRLPLDVHLMVKPVDALVEPFAHAGANIISFHPEATEHVDRSLRLIRSLGCQAGLVLNPATPLSWLDHVLDELDVLLLMSVNPGFGGQSLLPSSLPKLAQARRLLDHYRQHSGREVLLQVDGGIKLSNIAEVTAAGADVVVMGSAVFSQPDHGGGYHGVLAQLRQKAEEGRHA